MELLPHILNLTLQYAASERVGYAVQELNTALNTSTNVYYAHSKAELEDAELVLRRAKWPQILLTAAANYELKQHFAANVLTVVQLSADWNANTQAVTVLQKCLKSWQGAHLLLVAKSELSMATAAWQPLFKTYWDHGFGKILLLGSEGQLLTIEPFPQLSVVGSTLQAYQATAKRQSWQNLHKYPVRVLVNNDAPFSIVYRDESNGEWRYEGVIVQFFRLFAGHCNAEFRPVQFPTLRRYSTQECLGYIERNLTDGCASVFVALQKYPTSAPLQISYVYLMVPYGDAIAKFRYFFKPFDRQIWLCLIATICYMTLVLAMLRRQQAGVWDAPRYFLVALQSLLYLGFEPRQLRLRLRLRAYRPLVLLLCGTGFVLSNLYLTLLSSMLTTKLFQRSINNLADLRANNISLLLSSYDKRSMDTFGATAELRERAQYVDFAVYLHHRDALDTKYAYMDLSTRLDVYLYQQKFLRRPRMRKLPDSPGGVWAGQVIRENWVLEQMFNSLLLRVYETGLYAKIHDGVHEWAVKSGTTHFLPTEQLHLEPLNLKHFVLPALILAVGYIAAALACLWELCTARCNFNLLGLTHTHWLTQ